MHCSSSAVNLGAAMRTARFAAFHLLPSACRREQRESGSNAATGRTVSGAAVLRKPQVRRAAGARTERAHQPKACATTDAVDGYRSLVPEAESQSSCTWTRDLSVSAPRCLGYHFKSGHTL